ncbi:MAG: hypothetical protein SX243_00745 [Acidobacteriota bacterium]|nr:hypothetical protein [Acidobacteriota bacterium]
MVIIQREQESRESNNLGWERMVSSGWVTPASTLASAGAEGGQGDGVSL